MKVAYLYNRKTSEGSEMGAEKTFADYTGTERRELRDMLDRRGLRAGDTLLLRAVSDLGKGQESARIQRMISDLGATIQLVPGGADKVRGRPKKMDPTPEQKAHLCSLWHSAAERKYVMERAAEIMGGKVSRDQMYRWCGARDGKTKKEGQSDD